MVRPNGDLMVVAKLQDPNGVRGGWQGRKPDCADHSPGKRPWARRSPCRRRLVPRVDLTIPAANAVGQADAPAQPGGLAGGDFYIVLQIHTPPAKTDEARDFYREMRASMPFNPL